MPNTTGLASIQIQDADGEVTSLDIPFINSTSLLADIISWVTAIATQVDLVVDGKLNKIKVCIAIPLPGGVKSVAVAGSEIERTALFNFSTPAVFSSYSEDYPAFKQSLFVGNAVNTAAPDVALLLTYLTTPTFSTEGTDRDGNPLGTLNKARKTFRKHRKSTAKA